MEPEIKVLIMMGVLFTFGVVVMYVLLFAPWERDIERRRQELEKRRRVGW